MGFFVNIFPNIFISITEAIIRNESSINLEFYQNKESVFIYIVSSLAIKHFSYNSDKYNVYISDIFDVLYYRKIGIDLNRLCEISNEHYNGVFQISDYEDFIFDTLTYEDRLRLNEYIFKTHQYSPSSLEIIREIKEITLFLKCRKKDVANLINKYEVVF